MSDSNRTQVRYVPETVYGTTPTDDAGWKPLPINSENLSVAPVTKQSNRIRGTNRMPADLSKVNTDVGGPVAFEFSYGDFDDFIAAAMMGGWVTNVCTAGADYSVNQFTLEKQFADLTDKYIYLKGCRVGKLDLSFLIDDNAKGNIMFAGADGAPAATSLVGLGSEAAPTNNEIITATLDSVTYDGVAIATSGIVVTRIDLSIDNALRARKSLTALTPVDQRAGTHRFTGSIEAYVADESWEIYQDMVNNTGVTLAWTVTDSTGKGYTFSLPELKLSGQAPGASGLDTDNMIKADFTGLNTVPTITRIP